MFATAVWFVFRGRWVVKDCRGEDGRRELKYGITDTGKVDILPVKHCKLRHARNDSNLCLLSLLRPPRRFVSLRRCISRPKPEQNLELLDSPGIIPARQEDQHQALKLAICNDIGQASYDTQVCVCVRARGGGGCLCCLWHPRSGPAATYSLFTPCTSAVFLCCRFAACVRVCG